MGIYLGIVAAGIAVRQADRWWFSPRCKRRTAMSLRAVMALQRERLNDVTPVHGRALAGAGRLVSAGHTRRPLGVGGGGHGGGGEVPHFQEVSHFAVHGVLTPGRRMNVFAEAAVHVPLGFVPVPVRRRRHVREHHPNATVVGADPT